MRPNMTEPFEREWQVEDKELTDEELDSPCGEKPEAFLVSDDWKDCDAEIRCIFPNQTLTDPFTETGRLYMHNPCWYHGMLIATVDLKARIAKVI